ncbi:MAG: D-alanyl-D-alanine carboxypeptidase [Eubacterium sp.]|nr:D-alanyl-D-alanine carboxypeptidase [Eubacterium sp.]
MFIFDIPCFAESKKNATEIAGNASATDADYLPSDAPSIKSSAAIVMDIDTGDVLYEKNAHQQLYPAQITKILTCLLALEKGNVNDSITISDSVMSQFDPNTSFVGLEAGETVSLNDLIYGMILSSGDECALSIAEYLGGSTEDFASLMNKKASQLGCMDSNFIDPNGNHYSDHYSSCYDMALIGKAAYQFPEFKKIISSQYYCIPKTNKSKERGLWQDNRLIYVENGKFYYEFSTGGKAGYTDEAEGTLISFAERDGRRLCCVVMKCDPSTDTYLDTIKLYNFCYTKYKLCKPLIEFEINQINADNSTMLADYYNDLNHSLPKYYVNQSYSFYIRSFISDNDIEKKVELFDKAVDNKVGKIQFIYEGQILGEADINIDMPYVNASSTDSIKTKQKSPEKESKILLYTKRIIVVLLILIILVLTTLVVLKIRKILQIKETKKNIKYFPISKDKRKE